MSKLGHNRERAWVHKLREQGFWAQRAPGSLGIDVIAAAPSLDHAGFADLRFYELKANKDGGPYMNFRPEERRALLLQAAKAGASAYLIWWPARAQPRVIPVEEWPVERAAA